MTESQFLTNLMASNPTYYEVVEGYQFPKRGIAQISKMSGYTKTLPATGLITDEFLEDFYAYLCPMEDEGEDVESDKSKLTGITAAQRKHIAKSMREGLGETEKVVAPLNHYEEWGTW